MALDCDIYITGSDTRLLSGELATYLGGQYARLANLRYEDAPGRQYLTDMFNAVQLKDIVRRNRVRDGNLWSGSSPM